MYEFPAASPILAVVRVRGGEVTLIAEERDTALVDVAPYASGETSREAAQRTRVGFEGDTLTVEPPDSGGWLWRRACRVRLTVRVPLDSRLDLRVASADARVDGRWAEASINTASGDITVAEITGDSLVKTASGDVHIGAVGGSFQATSASGDLRLDAVGGDAALHTASGDIGIDDVGGSVTGRSSSGDITIHQARHGDIRLHAVSGDITVGVAPGTGVRLDVSTVSGSTHSDLPIVDSEPAAGKGADVNLKVHTVSGDVRIERSVARLAAARSHQPQTSNITGSTFQNPVFRPGQSATRSRFEKDSSATRRTS